MLEIEKPLSITGLDNSFDKGSKTKRTTDKIIARYTPLKQRSQEMGRYLQQHALSQSELKLSEKILECFNYLKFHDYYTIGEIKLMRTVSCKKQILCPLCAKNRAARMMSKYQERFDHLFKLNPNLVPVFLTLTVKNGDDLNERFNHLKNSFKTLLDRRRKGQNTELTKTTAGVYSFEFTNNGNGWHPHIHAILLREKYINVKNLTAEWKKITGDSQNTDLRQIKPDANGSIIDSLLEVFKYSLKYQDLDLEKNFYAYKILKGKRLQSAFGDLWGIKISKSDENEIYENLPYRELIFKYMAQAGYSLYKNQKPYSYNDELQKTG